MRDSTSKHHESISAAATDFWPNNRSYYFRPILNLKELIKLIHEADKDKSASSADKGKKRTSSSSPDQQLKRIKITATPSRHGQSINEASDELPYPHLNVAHHNLRRDSTVVPVLRHVLDIRYSGQPSEEVKNATEGDNPFKAWDLEEERFRETLKQLSDSVSEPQTLDLGPLHFAEYVERLVAVSANDGWSPWLVLLPMLLPENHVIDSLEDTDDLLLACYVLHKARKSSLSGHLKLVIIPSSFCDSQSHELPISLEIEIRLSLDIPAIFSPISRKEAKKWIPRVENSQRRVLEYLYKSDSDAPIPSSFTGSTNISYFYSILGSAPPLASKIAEDAMQPKALIPTLLPFQRRTVAWLLDREGKSVTPEGDIVPKTEEPEFAFWKRINERNHTWYFNPIDASLSPEFYPSPAALGGILAEEPGLGKTLETIALIMLNPAPPERNPSVIRWDPEANLDVKAIKTNLIVTPPALASQWVDELATHAPSLKVLIYDGWMKVKVPIRKNSPLEEERLEKLKNDLKWQSKKYNPAFKKSKSRKRASKKSWKKLVEVDEMNDQQISEDTEWCTYVHNYDVVITTYQVLRSDVNVARAAPVRPRRQDVVYYDVERPRSPLVMVEWNRVIMDEVQMVGGGKIEDMVSLIPRLSSLAVSGTPARAEISDLLHVLKFLRVDSIAGSAARWNRLLRPEAAGFFAAFFQHYAIRTMKANIKDELAIPQQTRYLVPIELGKIERHVYDQTLESILLELGLDARGVATSSGWQVDGTILRSSLRKLRGICTHPQVGQLVGDKLYKPGALKTIDAVLESMRDQNWRNLMDDWKAQIQTLIRLAQLQQHDKKRYQHALETLLSSEKEVNSLIEEITTVLAGHDAKGILLVEEAIALREQHSADEPDRQKKPSGKEKEKHLFSEDEEGEIAEEKDLPRTPAGDEHKAKRRGLQQRLREARITLHRVKFLLGDVYHVLGVPHAQSEDAAYQAAEEIRRGLLRVTEQDANIAMELLSEYSTRKRIKQEDLIIKVPFLGKGGIRSADLMVELNEIVDEVLNEQSEILWRWRAHITGLLTRKLNPGEGEADGQEYQRTLDDQGEAETYLESYSALLADRREALMNERTLLAAHDVREKRLRHTRAAIRAANATNDELEILDGMDIQPEHEVLHRDLTGERKEFLERLQGRAVRSILIDLNAAGSRIYKDDDPEKQLITEAVAKLRRLVIEQGSLQDKLDADLALIRKAFNQRILYFRQLQEISDSVTDVEWEGSLEDALEACIVEKTELQAKLNTNRARHRYLLNLEKSKEEVRQDNEETCILCQWDFTRGFITQCAHLFCEGCMKAWLLRREGKSCPICRVGIDPDSLQRFTVNSESDPPPQPRNGEPIPRSLRQIEYNKIDQGLFANIQKTESFGDFGTKIQTLVRHLLYLQQADSGSKSIVFSAWADSLQIVEYALNQNGIRCLRIDRNTKKESAAKRFKTDPTILVLLLHGERENAGLNITCASRVFLLESVVHHSFEIQAIARIDRMGQTRQTEVFCYYAEDTIERNILDLAARQGLSLYTKDNAAGTLNVSSFTADSEKKTVDGPKVKKGQKGDFIYKIDDMLAILFPHMYEDIEHLIPASEDFEMDHAEQIESGRTHQVTRNNAIAGPSKLT